MKKYYLLSLLALAPIANAEEQTVTNIYTDVVLSDPNNILKTDISDASIYKVGSLEGDAFTGFCLDSDNENATVQMSGYVKMNYSDTAPALGKNALVFAADGTVQENAAGTPCTVLAVDENTSTVEFLF